MTSSSTKVFELLNNAHDPDGIFIPLVGANV